MRFNYNLNYTLNATIVTKFGTDIALFLNYFKSWTKYNLRHKKNIHDGSCWTYGTAEELREIFPFWTTSKIYYLLKKMQTANLLLIGNYNSTKFYRTAWYALTPEAINLFPEICDLQQKVENTQPDEIKYESDTAEEIKYKSDNSRHFGKLKNRFSKNPTPTHYIYINNNKHNNSNTVDSNVVVENLIIEDPPHIPPTETVNTCQINEQIQELTVKKERLEVIDKKEGKKLQELRHDSAALYEHLKYLGNIRGEICTLENQIERLKQELQVETKKKAKENVLETQVDYVLNRKGERKINNLAFYYLLRALQKMQYTAQGFIRLVNEIVFEVRFGSLTKNRATGNFLTVEHAINIALKLIREKRWGTPTAMMNMCFQG